MDDTDRRALYTAETLDLLSFFRYDHLPPKLQGVSRPFAELAAATAESLPPCAETVAALRKLLEAKDCAVRAELRR